MFLTKNGRGRFVVLDIEDYERGRAEKKLLMKLHFLGLMPKTGKRRLINSGIDEAIKA